MKTSTNDNLNIFGCESQNQKILEYLRKGETLTTAEAYRMFGSIRLPSRMQDLGSRGIEWDSATACAVNYYDADTNKLKKKYVSGYFLPDAFGERYHLSDREQMRDLAKAITEKRINTK